MGFLSTKLNAHFFIGSFLRFKEFNLNSDLFIIPKYLNSYTYEDCFCCLGPMTITESTVINFSTFEVFQKN